MRLQQRQRVLLHFAETPFEGPIQVRRREVFQGGGSFVNFSNRQLLNRLLVKLIGRNKDMLRKITNEISYPLNICQKISHPLNFPRNLSYPLNFPTGYPELK